MSEPYARAAVRVRAASPAAAEGIARVHVASWQATYRGHVPDAFLDGMNVGARAARWRDVLLATESDTLVSESATGSVGGFISLGASRDANAAALTAEIFALYVHPDVVRAGHGTALLAAALGQAAERGYQQTTLWVLASNAVARAFYERRGFVADGVTKDDDRGDFSLHEVRYMGGVARG